MEIKKIGIAEIKQLQIIGKQTFLEAFGEQNTAENIQLYLDNAFSLDKLASELANSNAAFYFTILDDKIIGYLKINLHQIKTGLKDENALEIQRIYVLKEFYGKNIGQILCNTAFEIAKETKADYIWLGVWSENLRAINFYKKNNFIEFGKHTFKLGNDVETGIVMKLDIIKDK
jgi:diamine N-acetyltransferase